MKKQQKNSPYRTLAFHKFYLKITALVIGSFAPIFFLGTMEAYTEPARWSLDLLAFPLDGQQTYNNPTTRFLSALTGGFLLGWGVLVWCLSVWVYDAAPEGVRKTVVVSLLAWFILDSLGSVTAGVPANVIANILILLLAVGPLWWKANKLILTK